MMLLKPLPPTCFCHQRAVINSLTALLMSCYDSSSELRFTCCQVVNESMEGQITILLLS